MNELLNGRIEIGERLSLPYFSDKLKCSVTPIREALTQLAYVRIIEAVPNRGFIIPELSAREAKNIYELIAALEALALENSNFSSQEIKHLKQIQQRFQKAEAPLERIQADFELHNKLIRNYNNPLLLQTISDIKIRIFSYEREFMNVSAFVIDSSAQHQKIIQAIGRNQNKVAANLLKQNWHIMLDFIQKNLK